jgi:aminopeptidase N
VAFSAPVVLETELSDDALFVLLSHDHDPFNRWEAAQKLALRRILAAVHGNGHMELDARFIDAMRGVLRHPELDAAFKELVLTLPSEAYVAEQLEVVDPQRIHKRAKASSCNWRTPCMMTGSGLMSTTKTAAAYSPDAGQQWPPCAGQPGVEHAGAGCTRHVATRSGLARPCSASRTQPT